MDRPARIVPLASSAQPTAAPPARITLGAPQQIFGIREPNSFGLFNVPDMHTAVLQPAFPRQRTRSGSRPPRS